MIINILPAALDDLDRGQRFYARQGCNLGDHFLDSLFADIDSLEIYAGLHAQVFAFHRLLAKRFPYAVSTLSFYAPTDSCRFRWFRRSPSRV